MIDSVFARKFDILLDVMTNDNSEVVSSCKPKDDEDAVDDDEDAVDDGEDAVDDGEDLKNFPLLIELTLLSAPEVVEDANSGLLMHSLELLSSCPSSATADEEPSGTNVLTDLPMIEIKYLSHVATF